MAAGLNKKRFWQELRDRKVLRTATVYIAAAFGLLETLDIISGPLHFPGLVITLFIIISITLFPTILILSWFFDLTPDGIRPYRKSTPSIDAERSTDQVLLHPDPFRDDSFIDHLMTPDPEGPGLFQIKKSDNRAGWIYGISSFGVIIVVIILFLFYSGSSPHFSERDWVVLGDFENRTEESIFDRSLNTAFEISIDQSRQINVIPRRRMVDVLKRMGEEPGVFIDEELCRDIALREGASVYIVPGISRVGHQYILTGKIQEPLAGNVIRSEVLYVENEDDILSALDRLCKKMRRHLGESRYRISEQDKPLARVTTSSLDALKQFSLAIEYHVNLEFAKAVEHYRNAIGIDSSFTSAKASLGNILFERFDREEGKKWLDEAMPRVDQLTDREKYGILAFYAANVEQDLEKSVAYTKMNLELYPDNQAARNNLAWYYQNMGRYREAVEEYKAAIRLDPHTMLPYAGLLWTCQEFLGQVDSVLFWADEMIRHGPENPWGYFHRGSAQAGLGDWEKASASFEKARELDPGLVINLYRLAHTCRITGQYPEAIETLKSILDAREEGPVYYNLGIVYGLAGNEEAARKCYDKFREYTTSWENSYPDNPSTYFACGSLLSRLGRTEEGLEAARRAFEMDSSFHYKFAQVLAIQGRHDEALDHLAMALENGYRDVTWIILDPDIVALKDEPRFSELLQRYFPSVR